MATATAACGSVTGAVARQAATLLFSDLLITLINRVLIPVVYLYIAVTAATAALGSKGHRRHRRVHEKGGEGRHDRHPAGVHRLPDPQRALPPAQQTPLP